MRFGCAAGRGERALRQESPRTRSADTEITEGGRGDGAALRLGSPRAESGNGCARADFEGVAATNDAARGDDLGLGAVVFV